QANQVEIRYLPNSFASRNQTGMRNIPACHIKKAYWLQIGHSSLTCAKIKAIGVVFGSGTFGNVGLTNPPRKRKESSTNFKIPHNQRTPILAIQHRWISIQGVEMLFPAQLPQATTEQESHAFSFKMHSSASPTHYDFLDPLN
ncbi:hypothetical protein G9A89_000725, partial [Geosiphon pyriformis]